MEKRLEKFFEYQGNLIRSVFLHESTWFAAKDVCKILAIRDTRQAVERLFKDERCLIPIADMIGRTQRTWMVNEFGLYALILSSRKKEAKSFKRWVTHEVLPSIRLTGSYGSKNGSEYWAVLQVAIDENERLREEIEKYDELFENAILLQKQILETVQDRAKIIEDQSEFERVKRKVRISKNGSAKESLA